MSSQYDLIGQQNHFEIYFNQLSILKDGDFTHSSGFIRVFLEKKRKYQITPGFYCHDGSNPMELEDTRAQWIHRVQLEDYLPLEDVWVCHSRAKTILCL